MKLATLLSDLDVQRLGGPAPEAVEIHAVTPDSRRVEPGSLFVAFRGNAADGHDFVGAAVRAGAGSSPSCS